MTSSSSLPTGTVTFLLTDIEGSTASWEAHPEAMRKAVSRHHALAFEEIERHGGARPQDQGEGDSIFGAFAKATDAVECALDLQLAFAKEAWPTKNPIRVRMAIHTGEIELRDDRNYFGTTINRCARLRAIAHGGQVLVSLATYEVLGSRLPGGSRLKDLGLHLLKDLASQERVYQLVHPDLPEEFPSLKSLDALPNNLPVQLDSFVGRDQEMNAVRKLLADNRLVTLTGAAGCGKTRLAVQAAADLLDSYPDGVWFVDLAPVSDPDLVPQSAANALGLMHGGSPATGAGLAGEQDSAKRLAEHIRSKSTVLVLDNCEHLISACAQLSDGLLRSCTNLRIVATSREPLGVAGEASFRVPSLSTPDPDHLPTMEEIGGYEAVALFEDRAAKVQSDFAITADNAHAIAQICRRLEGIPLAIELAAARVTTLMPEQIAARLDDTFRLLVGGSRTALERQQTLRAAVDWSYRLLSDHEQLLLSRLFVFAGGFTLEAAEAVCAGNDIASQEVLDLLTNLVAKSLVQKDAAGVATRFKLLETIRQYAREKANESEDVKVLRTAHRDFYLDVADQAADMDGSGWGDTVRVFESEHDNLRTALEWSLEEPDPTPALRLAGDLGRFWAYRGYSQEGGRWLDLALSKAGNSPSEVRATALATAAWVAMHAENYPKALLLAQEALDISSACGFKWGIASALAYLGNTALGEGKLVQAQPLLEESLAVAREIDNAYWQMFSLSRLGVVAWLIGNPQGGRILLEEALSLARKKGIQVGLSRIMARLADLGHEDGDFERERSLREKALPIAREVGDKWGLLLLLASLATLADIRGDHASAGSLWEEALSIARGSGEVSWLVPLSDAALSRNDYAEARAIAEECLVIYREIGDDAGTADSLNWAGWAAYLEGDLHAARTLLEECVSISRATDNKWLAAGSLLRLGDTAWAQGELGYARSLLDEGLAISRESGLLQFVAAALESLGEVARAEGDTAQAESLHHEALTLRRQAGLRLEFAPSLERFAGLAAARDEHDRAARLFGAAESLREAFHTPIPPVRRPGYESDLALVREGLDEATFHQAWLDGRAMTPDEAVEFALGP